MVIGTSDKSNYKIPDAEDSSSSSVFDRFCLTDCAHYTLDDKLPPSSTHTIII